MRLSTAEKVMAELGRVYCDAILIITGGEPTLHPEFTKLVDIAAAKFKKVVINTNGSFNDKILEHLQLELQKNVFIQFSLDGTKDVHNRLRNIDLFDCVIDKLDKMQCNYKHIALSTTVSKTNYDNIVEFTKLLNNFKFSHLKVSLEQVINPLKDDIVSYKEWNTLVDNILDTAKFRVHTSKLFDFKLWDKYAETVKHGTLLSNCGYGYAKFYVDSEFNVLPCSCTDDKIGNLLSDSIEFIDNRLKEISEIKIPETSICYACRYREICNGGCPGYSIKVFGKKGSGDFRCPFVTSKIKEKC